ncbi:hypothetical protein JZ751_023791, partial [Albula glossodonta]
AVKSQHRNASDSWSVERGSGVGGWLGQRAAHHRGRLDRGRGAARHIDFEMSSDGQEVIEQSVVEMALPSRHKFQQLTKDQLLQLVAEEEVEVPEGILKPALAKLLIAALDLEELWADDERERAVAERERVLQAEREEHESQERLAQFKHDQAVGALTLAGVERPPVRASLLEGRHLVLSGLGWRSLMVMLWPGHVQFQCLQHSQLESQAKVIALVASLTKSDEAICSRGPREVPPSSYKPFTSVGTVSVALGGEAVSITMLCATGAAQSLLLEGAIELPSSVRNGKRDEKDRREAEEGRMGGVAGLYTPVRSEITSLDAGNIDDILTDIAQRYRISKYPTLKLFRNGMMMKREYRGQRSVSAIADFIRQQKVDPVKEVQSLEEITTIDRSKRTIIGYFEQKDSENYHTFEKELTEEGIPFLILFHVKDDNDSLEKFQHEVARQLISEKGSINFLHADCDKFRHPLLHIQKTPADCPVIAIDSFRHMYVFPEFNDLA